MKKSILIYSMICAVGCASVVAQEAVPVSNVEKAAEEVKVTVTGKVVNDATGEPVPGASVSVTGYPYSAMTDDAGAFTLRVPESKMCELQVVAPNFASINVSLRGRDEVAIRLIDESYSTVTNQQILTPLGLRERSHLTSATSVVAEDNSLSVKGSPEALLQGKVAGLRTDFRTGADGAAANLYLRGYNSIFASNQPLLVIDGMVLENHQFGMSLIEGQISTPLGCIDVKDIDQIAVLKDATAIYGVKGANGAILIQTKHTSEQATRIDVSALWGMNMQPEKLPMLGAADAKRYLTEVAQTSGLSAQEVAALPWVNASLPIQKPTGGYLNGDYYKYNNNTDWQDEIFQTGFKQQYSLMVTGGDEDAIYGVSVGFQQKDGLIEGSDLQRFNARVNAAIKFTDRIRLNANMSFIYGEKNLSNQGIASNVNPLYTALTKAPFTSPYSIDETNTSSPAFEDVDALGAANPTVVVSDLVSENSFYRFMGSYNLEVDLMKDLLWKTTFGLDFNKEREVIFYPTTGIPYGTLPTAEISNQQMHRVERLYNIFTESNLTYNKTWDDHKLTPTVGLRYFHATAEDDYGHGYNSASNYYQTLSAGDASLYQNGGSLGNWNWLSFYGNVDYNYQNRYFAQVVLSSDASSRYGENIAPLQIYPSVSAAWLLSSEEFMSNASWVDLLKLRASWTVAGNDDIGNYNAKRYYLSQFFLANNGLVRGNLMNEDLKPERVTKMNVGLDMAFFNERLNFAVDFYKSKTEDLLIYSNAESFTGFDKYVSNGGELENMGVEVALGARAINNRHFTWDLNARIGHNQNEITKLDCGAIETTYGNGVVRTQVGSNLGIFYGYETNGIYATTAEAQQDGLSTMVGAVAKPFQAGDVRFVNQNDDKLIDEKDCVEIGDPTPDFYGGFTSVMRSHRFTLSAEFTFSVGNDIYNYTRSQLEGMDSFANQTKAVLNRWRTEGDVQATMPRAQYGDPMGNNRFSDRWIEDGSYFKFKSLTLSYDFPISGSLLTGLTVYGTCENLFTLTDYKGYDPEIIAASSNNPLYSGIDAFVTPTTRTFYIGLKIGL